IEVARILPGRGVDVLLREGSQAEEELPLIVQSACGLGRVVLIAFDLDAGPFLTWTGQKSFVEQLNKLITPLGEQKTNTSRDTQQLDVRHDMVLAVQSAHSELHDRCGSRAGLGSDRRPRRADTVESSGQQYRRLRSPLVAVALPPPLRVRDRRLGLAGGARAG